MGSEPGSRRPGVLVYGAGAVGSLLGGLLAAAGTLVCLLGRPALAEAVAERGLVIHRPAGDITTHPPVITTPDQLTVPVDLVLLTVKAYAVEAALPDLARLAGRGAAVVALQNGVGTEERLLAVPEIRRHASGAVTVSVGTEGPGIVRQETGGGLTLAAMRGEVPLEGLAGMLRAAGLTIRVAGDYQAVKWSKLLLNIMANATAATLALSPARIYTDPRLFRVERAAFLEALAVMRALGIAPIRLPGYNVPLLARAMRLPAPLARRLLAPRVARGRGDKRPSLWLDVEAGRGITEVGWLNGAVADYGRWAGIATPINAALTELVAALSRDLARRSQFAGRPEALLAAVASHSDGGRIGTIVW